MSGNPNRKDYILVGRRTDQDTGRQFDFWAKRKLSEAQLDEEFRCWRQLAKEKHPDYQGGSLTVWIEDTYFDFPEKEPIQPPAPARGNGT
jgi:hypothetical protein